MLSVMDRVMLRIISEKAMKETGEVAEWIGPDLGHSKNHRSAKAFTALASLEARGLVTRVDGRKPYCWLRTAAGTAALEKEK